MSAAPPQVDIKPLPGQSNTDLSRRAVGSNHDLGLHASSLNPSINNDNDDEPPNDSLGSTQHTAAFDFAYQDLQGEPSLGSLQQEHEPSVLATPQQQQDISSTTQAASTTDRSITARVPGLAGPHCQDRSTMDGSDDGSPLSHPQANILEDSFSDEIGLIPKWTQDAINFGGKSKEEKHDTAPAWTELKTKAGKERKRLPLACIACRRKKIRCSGEKPACKHCLRARTPCVYKVTTRKAAPRTDYMAMLDKRLKRMEERIIKVVPKNEQEGISTAVPRANVKPAIPGTALSSKGGSKKRGAEEAFGSDLEQWAKAAPRTNLESPIQPNATLIINETEESKLLQEGVEALPSTEIQEHLADVFFEHVYGQAYHILHKPSYMRKLRAGTLPPVLILSVCAMSARFSSHPKLNTIPSFLRGEEWASVARDIVTKRYEWANITILTCLLILGLHEFATCHGGRSWSLAGQAIRMAFALQLHNDLDHDPMRPGVPLSFVDREIRRRTMWACFLMDRFNSSGLERPTFIKEETLKIPLPVNEKNFLLDMPATTENLHGEVPQPLGSGDDERVDVKSNMGVAAYIVKAISLWGRVINYLNQGGKDSDHKQMWDSDSVYMQLVHEAEEMTTSLPENLAYNTDNLNVHETESMANQFVFLHIAIQQNILFLNRFAVSSPNADALQDIPKSFVTKAGAKAFGAANRISELLSSSESIPLTAPFAGYCAFLSGTVHTFGSLSGNKTIEATSSRNLATNIRFLNKMKRYWGMFHYMVDNLRQTYCTWHDAKRAGKPIPADATSSPIFQYGDWFDRYPHGVSQSDFVDPATYKTKEKGEDAVLEQKSELHTVEEFFTTLSPQSKDGSVRSNSMSIKRKSLAAKRNSIASRSSEPRGTSSQHLEPLLTDLTPEQVARLQHQARYPVVTMGGQTSGPTTFSGLGAVPHSAAYGTTLSPVSPVAISHGQFGAHGHHPHGLFPQDMLSLQLAQNGMLPHSMLGSYGSNTGLDPAATAAMMEALPGWSPGGTAENASGVREGSAPRGVGGADGPHNNPHHTVFGHGHGHDAAAAAAAAAWFPYDLDGSDMGDLNAIPSGLDGFGDMFAHLGGTVGRGGMNGNGGH